MRSAQGRLRDGSDLSLDQPFDWRRGDIALPAPPVALVADAALRRRWDRALLDWLRQGDAAPAQLLHDLSLGLAVAQVELMPRAFWKISAAFFEVRAALPASPDTLLKRLALHILLQCAAQVRGETRVPEDLARRLLAHCRTAAADDAHAPPLWRALRQAFAMAPSRVSDDWLNAADAHSQQLEAALAAWALTPQLPLPHNAAPWAWALSVSADDAGLAVLADFAGQLAQGLQVALRGVTADQAQMLAASAEHLRQLLHQHAAGFEKTPQPALLQGLRDMSRTTA